MNRIPAAISYSTYCDFAKKYKIPITKNKIKRTIGELHWDIERYEKLNNIQNGLYFRFNGLIFSC